ncbi:MAG: hypothetical protein ACXW3Z_11915, partial [Limisphaerales bacterium]
MSTSLSVVLPALLLLFAVRSAELPRLELQSTGTGAALRWDAHVPPVVGAESEYRVLVSSDLVDWTAAGEIVKVSDTSNIEVPLETLGGHRFFQLERSVSLSAAADDGAEMTGFNPVYKNAFDSLGEITLEQFSALYPPPTNYLEQITFDPTTAEYWNDWNSDPVVYNANKPPEAETRHWDFRLNESELATFKKLGFVVSERLSTA